MQQFDETVDGWDGWAYGSGTPQYFTVYEGKAVLFPIPNVSLVSGLKILYNQKPTDAVNLASTISLPLIYHNTLVKYCMWQASLLDEDHEPAAMYQNNFQGDINLLQSKETRDPTATYPTITTLIEDL